MNLSFLEPVCILLGLDPLDQGLQLVGASRLATEYRASRPPRPRSLEEVQMRLVRVSQPLLDPTRPLLIAHLRGRQTAWEVKRALLEHYPSEHAVVLVREEEKTELPLGRLDQSLRRGSSYHLFVPALSPAKATTSLAGLRHIVARLRAPGGCPWDREQTPRSLKPYLLEEAYEVAEALEKGSSHKLREELGDLLLQIVLHAQLAAERGAFTLDEVFQAIGDKLIRRHPHVFGDSAVADAAEVVRRWEHLKESEKQAEGEGKGSILDAVPQGLPALADAQTLQRKVARYGFDWPNLEGVLAKIGEELEELKAATSPHQRAREVGDLLFALVNALRWLEVDAEAALRQANRRFRRRFHFMEQLCVQRGLKVDQLSISELDKLWEEAKAKVG